MQLRCRNSVCRVKVNGTERLSSTGEIAQISCGYGELQLFAKELFLFPTPLRPLLFALQQKEMQVLTAQLKEQAAQIQKVSAQIEVSKPAPRTAANK